MLSGMALFHNTADGRVLTHATTWVELFCVHPRHQCANLAEVSRGIYFQLLEQWLRFGIIPSLQCRQQEKTIRKVVVGQTIQFTSVFDRMCYIITAQRVISQAM